ncbi:MAG: RNA polymerase sigma factor [Kineosporiaceae bacterium]|nr:RNA polymerase sigma factor [Kineosporiaceae bacterium]
MAARPEGDDEGVWRREAPHVLAALLRRSGDFGACEDAVQEALLAAAVQWPHDGVPDDPRAWLIRVAARRLIDARRSTDAEAARLHRWAMACRADSASAPSADQTPLAGDDTLQVLLGCAHPDLSDTSRVALTLRAVAGLSTRQIAALLFTGEATVAQRISRAKGTIRDSSTALVPPRVSDLPSRLSSVRHVLHLIFTAGHTASHGGALTDDALAEEALWLAQRLHRALPDDGETSGLLALMLLSHARVRARIDHRGDLIPLPEQDRSLWDAELIAKGVAVLEAALPHGEVGPFQLHAAIAAVHAESATPEATDWLQIVMLYRMLDRIAPSPTVRLNLAAAVGMAHGPAAGLDALAPLLADPGHLALHRVHATHAHLLEIAGRREEAREAYALAARLTRNIPEQRYLHRKAAAP